MKKPRCPQDGTMMQLVDPSNRHFGEKWICRKCGYAGDRTEIATAYCEEVKGRKENDE